MSGQIRIGISGWTYPPWRKVFYPEGLPHHSELAYASQAVRSIEINGTFYSLQRATSFRRWYDEVPDDFVFSVKGGRFITHMRRLKEAQLPLANFFASGLIALGSKLGPILWQLPPSFRFDRVRLEDFFQLLPRSFDEAAVLARRHTDRLPGRAALKPRHDGEIRHALEVRHPSFETPEFVELLREHRIAVVVADSAGKWPLIEDVTADFVYLRLHGHDELYRSGYTAEAFDEWHRKVKAWSAGRTPRGTQRLTTTPPVRKASRDVFVYFDNDVKVHAPFDAMALASRFGMEPVPGIAESKDAHAGAE